ncbi:MAG TPA: adenylate/guanylate cyclase domain-containing protein [Candidatus Limnocylindria bacterium]|nr:adenylate/guanylate cyclase domain-containing protein [Candidatus Limnocylindria bacterium]
MSEERKLVTILFADIVGSTELGQSHDPEVVRGALGRAFAVARDALEAHGGTVEKFIGDAVMAVFGVPAAHDDDPERAVRAAFVLRARIGGIASGSGPALRVRIGINTGEAVAGSGQDAQFLVTGPAVNAAARLQQAAAPDEIVVGDLTRRLTAGGVTYGAQREIEAKGIGRLIAWPAEALTTLVPEQHRGLPGLRAPLIGRDRELRTLVNAHASLVGREQPHLVTVYGPAGSGKSRLTSELLEVIGRERVRVGRCLPYGEGITYYPVQLIVRADAGIELDDPREQAIAKVRAAALEAFAGDVADADAVARRVSVIAGLERAEDALPELGPEELREELGLGLRRYLERRAHGEPLVLVFEDVHWAEPGLLALIEGLAEWSRAPLLLLCLARPDFREMRPTWGSAAANVSAITLAPLTAEETRRLIAALLAIDDLPESLRAEVVTRAEGNPLYVEEFLRMLMETGRVEHRGDRWVASADIASLEVPPTLQGLITARLDRVGADVKKLLQRASLAGRLFSTDALAALADGERPDPELLRDAIRRDLLIEADERALGAGRVFRFKHVLIRDVAYSTLPKSERSRLHDRYGRWLGDSLGDRRHEIADIIAFHAEQAFLLARELGAEGAPELGRRALDLLLKAAAAARDRVDTHAALGMYERAATIAETVTASPQELATIGGYRALLRSHHAVTERTPEHFDDAIAVARSLGPSAVLAELLLARANARRDRDLGGSKGEIDEALAVARRIGDAQLVSDVMWVNAFDAYPGDLEEMERRLVDTLAFSRQSGADRRIGRILVWLGHCAAHRGDVTAYKRYVDEGLATTKPASKFFRGITHQIRAWFLLRGLGDHAAAVPEAALSVALMRDVGQPNFVAGALWCLGEALLGGGDHAGARDALAEAAELFERRGQRGQIPEVKARLARALVRLGEIPLARAHAEASRAVQLESDPESRAINAVALAEVSEAEGDLRAADAYFGEAVALLEPTGFHYLVAHMREEHAGFLIRQGRGDEARALLEQVRDFWSDPLAERHRARIDALLAQAASLRT